MQVHLEEFIVQDGRIVVRARVSRRDEREARNAAVVEGVDVLVHAAGNGKVITVHPAQRRHSRVFRRVEVLFFARQFIRCVKAVQRIDRRLLVHRIGIVGRAADILLAIEVEIVIAEFRRPLRRRRILLFARVFVQADEQPDRDGGVEFGIALVGRGVVRLLPDGAVRAVGTVVRTVVVLIVREPAPHFEQSALPCLIPRNAVVPCPDAGVEHAFQPVDDAAQEGGIIARRARDRGRAVVGIPPAGRKVVAHDLARRPEVEHRPALILHDGVLCFNARAQKVERDRGLLPDEAELEGIPLRT